MNPRYNVQYSETLGMQKIPISCYNKTALCWVTTQSSHHLSVFELKKKKPKNKQIHTA